MPKLDGVEATRRVLGRHPGIRVIGLSMFEEQEQAQALREAGAVNYLSKGGRTADLIAAVLACVDEPGQEPAAPGDEPAFPEGPNPPRRS